MINVYNVYIYDKSKCIGLCDKEKCIFLYILSHNASTNFPIKKKQNITQVFKIFFQLKCIH